MTWLMMVVGAVALALVIRGVLAESAPQRSLRPPAVGNGQSAKQAYATLTKWTTEWASDAAIVSCTTSYSRYDRRSDAWQFQVYSAEGERIVAVRVQGSDVTVLRETAALFKQQTVPLADWTLDSDDAVQAWWRNGGEETWRRPEAEALHLRLGSSRTGQLTWQMTVTYQETEALSFWEIGAADGALISQDVGVSNE